MARAKKQKAGVDPQKEAETRALLNDLKNKFEMPCENGRNYAAEAEASLSREKSGANVFQGFFIGGDNAVSKKLAWAPLPALLAHLLTILIHLHTVLAHLATCLGSPIHARCSSSFTECRTCVLDTPTHLSGKPTPSPGSHTYSLGSPTHSPVQNDLADLEKAKRNFCSAYVDAMMVEFEKSVPEHLLNMKASEFVHSIKEADNNMAEQMNELEISGEDSSIQVYDDSKWCGLEHPSMITPRVDGPVIRSRQSRVGEVLFSVNGTPVMNTDHLTQQVSTVTKKEHTKVVEELLQQSETDMSPATRKIMQQLRVVLVKKTTTTTYEQGQEEQENRRLAVLKSEKAEITNRL
uniref:PDZ domain-containing protein n=1 Tax=Ditylenchus dipsaci TaxID=166011 RepID=A0A915DD20_9BILA